MGSLSTWRPAWGPQCLQLGPECSLCGRLRVPSTPSLVAWVPSPPSQSPGVADVQQWKRQPQVWSNLVGVTGESGSCGTSRLLCARPGAVVTVGEQMFAGVVYAAGWPSLLHPQLPFEA